MALSQRLQTRPGQTLAITPRQLQSLHVLQISTLELRAWLNDQLEQNPFLESVASGSTPPAAPPADNAMAAPRAGAPPRGMPPGDDPARRRGCARPWAAHGGWPRNR